MTEIFAADRDDMLGAVVTTPDQIRETLAQSLDREEELAALVDGNTIRSIIVCGMGGSGIGGDLVAATASLRVPVITVSDYELPAWAGEQDFVICVSYSGGTEETLSAFRDATNRARVACVVTTGGELGAAAAALDIPVIDVSSGYQPRAAVGLLYGAVAGVISGLGVMRDDLATLLGQAVGGSQAVLDRHSEWLRTGEGAPQAHKIARMIGDTVPIIYGVGPTTVVARRWKAQINENAKRAAWYSTYPELDHNEIVGFTDIEHQQVALSVIELVGESPSPQMQRRIEATREIIRPDVEAMLEIDAATQSRASTAFELLTLGDLVSVAIALRGGIDPTPVERIQRLKERLASEPV